jgi:uncharacterized membrane protein (UPF0136 family)
MYLASSDKYLKPWFSCSSMLIFLCIALTTVCPLICVLFAIRGYRGRDRMVVGLTATCTVSAYYH